MSVGRVLDKGTIDSQIASFGTAFNALFNQVQLFAAALDAQPDSYFTTAAAGGIGTTAYTAGEMNTLRSAYRDLNKFRQVYGGTMYVAAGATLNTGVPTANDATHFGYQFSLFVGQLDGIGY